MRWCAPRSSAIRWIFRESYRAPGQGQGHLALSPAGPLTSGAALVAVLVPEGMHVLVGAALTLGLGRSVRV